MKIAFVKLNKGKNKIWVGHVSLYLMFSEQTSSYLCFSLKHFFPLVFNEKTFPHLTPTLLWFLCLCLTFRCSFIIFFVKGSKLFSKTFSFLIYLFVCLEMRAQFPLLIQYCQSFTGQFRFYAFPLGICCFTTMILYIHLFLIILR